MTAIRSIVAPDRDAVRADLYGRAERLEARVSELSAGAEGVVWPEGTARDTARYYFKQLLRGDAEIAAEVLRVLVDESEAWTDRFWGTPLGQVLFKLGAFPEPEMSRASAQALLGLKSRQRVHQLILEGLLVETQGGTLQADSVRALMTWDVA
jgi:hypothetical protein